MADISKITLPNGNTYDIKDSTARAAINAFAGGDAIVFMGVSSTALTDGGNENPTVDGTAVTTKVKGQLYFYETNEFIYGDDNKWHALGSLESLGALAYKNTVKYDKATSASYTSTNSTKSVNLSGTSSNVAITSTADENGNYTPAGSVSTPTFTGNEATVNVSGTATGTVSQPSFTGTGVRLVTGNIAVPTSATFTGTEATIDVTGTATGTVSKPSFTGTKATGLTVSAASSGTATYTPAGTVSAPTVTVTPNTTTVNSITAVGTLPTCTLPTLTMVVGSEENLTIGWSAGSFSQGTLPTKGADTTVATGIKSATASAPTFTGTGKRLVLEDYTPTGSVSQPTFSSGTIAGSATYAPAGTIGLTTSNKSTTVTTTTGTATYTPGGTVSQPTFSNGSISGSGKITPSGTVSQPTFTGTKVKLAGTTTASGSITLPTISLGHTNTEATYE